VFGVADRVLVLMQGALVADGTPKAVAHDPQVRERYLGQDFDTHLAERGLPDARG
jgi:branched-chain amino acid transport system ATP-binding protein